MSEPVFRLPNGAGLPFAKAWHQGKVSDWRMTSGRVWLEGKVSAAEAIANRAAQQGTDQWWQVRKDNLPRVNLQPSWSDQIVVCADIDKLPSTYLDFDQLYAVMRDMYSPRAVVTRSPRGKVKIFFVVHWHAHKELPAELALKFLRTTLPEGLHSALDGEWAGLRTARLTLDMIDALAEGLPRCRPYDLSHLLEVDREANAGESLTNDGISVWGFPAHTYRIYEGSLDAYPELRKYIGRHRTREAIIRRLVLMWNLAHSGFQLDQKKFAREIGLRDHSQVSRNLMRLQDAFGLLVCTDAEYIYGSDKAKARGWAPKCKKYEARGELRKAVLELASQAAGGIYLVPLPAQIPDGEWDKWLYCGTFHFPGTPEAYLAWVRSMPSWDVKGRYQKAMRLAEKHLGLAKSHYPLPKRRMAASAQPTLPAKPGAA